MGLILSFTLLNKGDWEFYVYLILCDFKNQLDIGSGPRNVTRKIFKRNN